MTNIEIVTLAKAGYIVVAAEGQTQQNLQILSNIFLDHIPAITSAHAQKADRTSMREMVGNLCNFRTPHHDASLILSSLTRNFHGVKANILARELQEVLRTKKYSKSLMPELAIRIQMDNHLF